MVYPYQHPEMLFNPRHTYGCSTYLGCFVASLLVTRKPETKTDCVLISGTENLCVPRMYVCMYVFQSTAFTSNSNTATSRITKEGKRRTWAERETHKQRFSVQCVITSAASFLPAGFIYCPFTELARKGRGWKKERGHQRKREERENCSRHQRKCVNAGSCFLWSRMFRDGALVCSNGIAAVSHLCAFEESFLTNCHTACWNILRCHLQLERSCESSLRHDVIVYYCRLD